MKKQVIRLTETDLHKIIKNVIKEETFGGNPLMDKIVEVLETWEWDVDQINGNLIYAHLQEDSGLEIIVSAESAYNVYVKEVHFQDSSDYGMDTSYCIDLKNIIDKLAEIDV